MRTVTLLIPLLASVCAGAEWNALQVTYGKGGAGYYDMPWSVNEASAQKKWVKIEDDEQNHVAVYSQPEDPRVMLLFDKKGTIAGIRIAFLKKDIGIKAKAGGHKFEFDYEHNPSFVKAKYFGKELWHVTVLFASPETLASGGRKPLNKETDNVAEGVYFKRDGKWTELNRDECKEGPEFTEGNCYPGMGKHYFYKLDAKQECAHREPFFNLYDQGRLIGVGLSGYGSFTKNPKTQSYFEDFPAGAARGIMPNAPKCVEDYINKYGLTMMHVFLKKDAAKITCPEGKGWRSVNC